MASTARPFLVLGGDSADGDASWPFIKAVVPVYELLGAGDRIGLHTHKSKHTFPKEPRRLAHRWLDHWLEFKPVRDEVGEQLGRDRFYLPPQKITQKQLLGNSVRNAGTADGSCKILRRALVGFIKSSGRPGVASAASTSREGHPMSHRLILLISLVFPALVVTAEPRPPGGPLADLPSKPGPHIDRIKALGDNEWLHLGTPAADPKWGTARGRSWSSNQPAAPNLRGAFVFGEGVHAYVKPDGHYMNDVWFYDINAHRWVCLYPGIDVKAIAQRIKDNELTVNADGLLVEKDGQPVPPLLIHAYGNLGYDPERKKFVFFGSQFGNYFTTGEKGVFAEANKLFQERRHKKQVPPLSPFFYDVASGKFECWPVNVVPKGAGGVGTDSLLYVPSKKQFFFGGVNGVAFLDLDKRVWMDAKPTGVPPTGYDHCTAYDSKRDRVYYYKRDGKTAEENFLMYDLKENAWSAPRPKGPGPLYASANQSIFIFDPASDRLVSIRCHTTKDEPGQRQGVYAYDPATNSWAEPRALPPEVTKAIKSASYGFYDPVLNVYFCYFASDSRDDGSMWVYRFQKAR